MHLRVLYIKFIFKDDIYDDNLESAMKRLCSFLSNLYINVIFQNVLLYYKFIFDSFTNRTATFSIFRY